jgi:AcrR family transcriptional regulator
MIMNHVSSGRVSRKRDERAAAILDAATEILAAEGHDALTLGRLARALDLVPAALYRYFESKDALLAALQRRAVVRIHLGLGEAIAGWEEPLPKLLAAARFYLALPRTDPQAFYLVAVLLGDPRPLLSDAESQKTAPLLLALLGEVEQVFRLAVEGRVLAKGDGMSRTLAFWSVLQGALSLEKARRVAPSLPSADDVGGAAVRAMLIGWGADAGEVDRAARAIAGRRANKTNKKGGS